MQQFFTDVCARWQLGSLLEAPAPVSGGYMHKMFRLTTLSGNYAIKLLNPEVMARPTALDNYRRAEALENVLEANVLPIVPAMRLEGEKLQKLGERYYYLFPWVEGKALSGQQITPEHCGIIGGLLAKQHTLPADGRREQGCPQPVTEAQKASRPEPFAFDWPGLAHSAEESCLAIAPALRQALPLLEEAQNAYNHALAALPELRCICNGDMDPKNVLWQQGQPLVIDLECLALGNPIPDLVQLSLIWAGGDVNRFDRECFAAFLAAYRRQAGPQRCDWQALTGLGYAWLDWLNYSVYRACNEMDAALRQTGIEQTLETLERIRFHRSILPEAAQLLATALL